MGFSSLFQPLPAPAVLLGGFPQQQTLSQDGLPAVGPGRCFLFLRPPPSSSALSYQTHNGPGALSPG